MMMTKEERSRLHAATGSPKLTYAELVAIDVLLGRVVSGDHSSATEHERSARDKIAQERAAIEDEWTRANRPYPRGGDKV